MSARTKILSTAAFASAAVIAAFVAGGSASIIEIRSRKAVQLAMETYGHSWVDVQTDGLQVVLLGTAPSEAERLRAMTRAGAVVDSGRIVDNTDVENSQQIQPPDFTLEMLRNDDGISLIGLVPMATDRAALVAGLRGAAGGAEVTDLLEAADYPAPPKWQRALDFAIETIKAMPRAKISVEPGRVSVQAITDSPAEKTRIETSLARRRPADLEIVSAISAPRPVITPFTLRFVIDDQGARFDACSADTERARDRILAAARDAGTEGAQGCTVGMGTPSPQWADAVAMSLHALKELGRGTVALSDADISLTAAPGVTQESFDKVVGELESNLPQVFSLTAERERSLAETSATPQFMAILSENGRVELRGRVSDQRAREAVETYARARFGAVEVYGATRLDETLPQGWGLRTLAALDALDTLAEGSVVVTPDLVRVTGRTGDAQASDTVSRLLAQRLGEAAPIALDIRYDRRLDPVLGLPTGPECVDRLNAVLAEHKITFEPGSAAFSKEARATMDLLAAAMKDCQDFRMEIAGHTDSQGRDEMNLALSQDRAAAVLFGLTERRVLTGNLSAKGYGETQPIADNGTEAGREANRRIEFVLLDEKPLRDEPAPAPPAEAPAVAPPAEAPAADPAFPDETGDSAPMDEAPMDDTPADADAPAEAPGTEALPGQDPSIEVPVGPAQASPARPDARPDGLKIQP